MKKIFIWMAAAISVLASCTKEPAGTSGGGSADCYTLIYSVPSSIVVKGGVPAETGEDRINSLTLLFFEHSDNGSGKFVRSYQVPGLSGTSSGYIGLKDTFTAGLNESKDYDILAVANIESYLSAGYNAWINSMAGKTELEVTQSSLAKISGAPNDSSNSTTMIMPDNIPMSAKITLPAGEKTINIAMTRLVSRFDVLFEPAGYRMSSATIWNAYTFGSIFDYTFNDFSVSRTRRFYGLEQDKIDYDDPKYPGGYIKGRLYAFENFVPAPQGGDTATTCIIFGISEEISAGTFGTPRYFRISVNAKTNGQSLIRNHVYQITIKDVDFHNGYAIESEACYARPTELFYVTECLENR